MCLVIDTCCLSKVFDRTNQEHPPFAPVLDWITIGNGKMIYGGTKYNAELAKARRFLGIVAELERGHRAICISEAQVDELASAAKREVPDSNFNDEHLVALVIASRCHIVCTDDTVAMPYLKRPEFYRAHGLRKPRIYCYRERERLIHDEHIVGTCLEHQQRRH
jgi:hypothetical protein